MGTCLVAALIANLAGASGAAAGEFPVQACLADAGRFSTAAFEDFAGSGMNVKRACDPRGPGLRGLVTANAVGSGRVPRGARAAVEMRAPFGTRFRTFRWSGSEERRDCRYALQLYADGPGIAPVVIRDAPPNGSCPEAGRVQAAGWPRPRTHVVDGATRIVQQVVCVPPRGLRYCSSRSLNYIRTFSASAKVADVLGPSVRVVGGGLASGRWVRGPQEVVFDAQDNVGVRSERVFVGGLTAGQPRSCDEARTVPCPNGVGALRVNADESAEGSQPVTVQVTDSAGNVGSVGATALIDHTPPARVDVAAEGGEQWRNQNGWALGWSNPSEVDRAPITGARYRLCRRGSSDCTEPAARAGDGLARLEVQVPAPGEWAATVWREDAAGNADERLGSVPVTLRYDPEPPQLGFEQTSAADPTLVSVSVTDQVSGLAGGEIEIRQQGSASWQTLQTHTQASRLVARLDDSRLPAGTYEMRARAFDQARNEASTQSRLDGSPAVVTLPLRTRASLRAGVARKKTVRRTIRRRGERRVVRRRVVKLVPSVRVRIGRRVQIGGRLRLGRRGLARAKVLVYARSQTTSERLVGTTRTGPRGRFRYRTRARSSEILRFIFAGAPRILPAQREVVLRVPAASSLRLSRRRVLNGQSVVFRGRLRTLPPPRAGKLVELQVRLNQRWQTFRTVRSDRRGRFAIRYRFVATTQRLARYRFRARLPAEAGYPFALGRSSVVSVVVRGRG